MMVTDPTDMNKSTVELAFGTKLKDDATVKVKEYKKIPGATLYDVTVEVKGDQALFHVKYNHENWEVSFTDDGWKLLTESSLFRYLWLRCVAKEG